MPGMTLPPGFRFHPTDEELVDYYLKKRVKNIPIEFDVIADVDLYKCEPWDLPSKSKLPHGDNEWFFFSPRDRKYPNGSRTNRATEAGYWKATGRDRMVRQGTKTIGMKKTLVFYRGRAPHGERTDWLMHEYRLDGEEWENMNVPQDAYVLCRVFKKNGFGPPKNPSGGSGSLEEGDQVDSPGEVKSTGFGDTDIKPSMSSLANLPPLPQSLLRPEVLSVENHGAADSFATRPPSVFSDDPFVHNGSFRMHFNPDPDGEGFFLDEGLENMRNDDESLEDFYKIIPPLEGSNLHLGDEDLYSDMTGLMDSTNCVRNEFHKQWQEQFTGAYQAFGGQTSTVPKQEDFVLPPLHENDFGPLPTLVQLPSPPTASQAFEENDTESSCVSSASNNFATIRLRTRPSSVTSPAVGVGYASPYTASRRVLLQHRGVSFASLPQSAGELHPKFSSTEKKLSVAPQTEKIKPELTQSLDCQASEAVTSQVESEVVNSLDNSWVTNVIRSPAPEVSRGPVDDGTLLVSSSTLAPMSRKRVVYAPAPPTPTNEDTISVNEASSQASLSLGDITVQKAMVDEASGEEWLEKKLYSQENDLGMKSVSDSYNTEDGDLPTQRHPGEADAGKVAETSSPTKEFPAIDGNPTRVMGLKLLEPACALRDISSIGHTSSKQLPHGISSIHVNAVTVTCSCSSAGLPHVPTKACACYATFWEGRCDNGKSTTKVESSTRGQPSESSATDNPAPTSLSVGFLFVGILLPVLCVQLLIFFPSLSRGFREFFREHSFLCLRDLLFVVLGAFFFSLVQRPPMPLMRLVRRLRGVNSRPPPSLLDT